MMSFFKKKKPSRRKKYIINRAFQISFIWRISVLSLIVLIVVYAANTFFFWNLTQKAVEKGIPPQHIFFRFIEQQQDTMNIIFIFAALLIVAIIYLFGLLYSHRIAGPLYRLQQHLLSLASGNPVVEVKFRNNDYFPELAEAFNTFIRDRKIRADMSSIDPK